MYDEYADIITDTKSAEYCHGKIGGEYVGVYIYWLIAISWYAIISEKYSWIIVEVVFM